MIFTRESAQQQIVDLLRIQSGLHIKSETEKRIELTGEILVNCESKGYFLSDRYAVEIVIPLGSDKLPFVIDKGNRIAKDYPHRYKNGELCLETDTIIRIHFLDGFSLTEWINDFVEPYYFSYEFYQRYGEFPFGERGHGLQGILETYQELFQEENLAKVYALMKSICKDTYRGHLLCPCGSGKRFRVCHGQMVMKYYTDNRLKEIVRADYKAISSAVTYYEQLQYRKRVELRGNSGTQTERQSYL